MFWQGRGKGKGGVYICVSSLGVVGVVNSSSDNRVWLSLLLWFSGLITLLLFWTRTCKCFKDWTSASKLSNSCTWAKLSVMPRWLCPKAKLHVIETAWQKIAYWTTQRYGSMKPLTKCPYGYGRHCRGPVHWYPRVFFKSRLYSNDW